MPRLQAFNGVSQAWLNQIKEVASGAVKDGIEAGAEFMRNGIMDSPTGTPWHIQKNQANGFGDGARIGNNNPNFGSEGVDPNSGKMLNSVDSLGPTSSASGSEIAGIYGWINVREDYFLLQDVGNYGVGKQSGMGLLNKAMNPQASVTQMGAKIEAESQVAKTMLAAGFKYTGSAF